MKQKIMRRTFLKQGAIAAGGVAVCNLCGTGSAAAAPPPDKSPVFFTKDISAKGLLEKVPARGHLKNQAAK